MSENLTERELLQRAVLGHRDALQELLLSHSEMLNEFIARRLPSTLRSTVSEADIMQDTFADALRDIRQFTWRDERSFGAWLVRIAKHRLHDAIRRLHCAKRGGGRVQVHFMTSPDKSSVADLVEVLSGRSWTPSRSFARREVIAAVQQTIDTLPEDYRQAVQLRLLMGKPLDEVADIMGRSPRAIQGLVDRAKAKMRAALGRFSLYE